MKNIKYKSTKRGITKLKFGLCFMKFMNTQNVANVKSYTQGLTTMNSGFQQYL